MSLPVELSESDQLAVARVHFPNLADDCLELVVSEIMKTERDYVSDIAKIARHAKDNAQENGPG